MISKLLLLGSLALQATAADLPQLKLPWGTWQATVDPIDPNIYRFENVRFGAEPQRFGAPSFPDWKDETVQPETDHISCIQVDVEMLPNPPGGKHPLGSPADDKDVIQSEDCLFLDIYAPASAFEPGAEPLPVIVWIFGGAYAFGNKNQGGPLYTGHTILKASDYNAIFIAGNYRVGAFGFLSGDYMQKAGLPNAGLHDQALLFQWVQDHIHQVGGNKHSVSAWGESAGAGSILHHLIREDGTKDPLFHTYAAMSPAFEWAWDNSPNGRLDSIYRNFSELAECGHEYNMDCLRAADIDTLRYANTELYTAIRETGLFPVGPAVDGTWVKTIPTISFSQGKVWGGANKAIVSHVGDEASLFAPEVKSQEEFDAFLNVFFPGEDLTPQKEAINRQYDCPRKFLGNFQLCISTVIRDASFTCNTRDLFEAYPNSTYMMDYSFPISLFALHGTDLAALYTRNKEEAQAMFEALRIPPVLAKPYAEALHAAVAPHYQKYFASFALAGDPNALGGPVIWPLADETDDELSNVLLVFNGVVPENSFVPSKDNQNKKSTCNFWTVLATSIVEQDADSALAGGSQEL